VVSNSGSKPIQIIAIYIDQKDSSHQITPEKLHVVLDPGTQAEATIQKEWLDNSETKEFGILDALGKRHPISQSNLKELSEKSNSLPTNKKNYENKETGEIVQAFQVKDPASITSKIKG
jgi:phage gp29-like protein